MGRDENGMSCHCQTSASTGSALLCVCVCAWWCARELAERGQGRVFHQLSSRYERSHHPWPHPREKKKKIPHSCRLQLSCKCCLCIPAVWTALTVYRLWKKRGITQTDRGWTGRRRAAERKVSLRSQTPLIACGSLRRPRRTECKFARESESWVQMNEGFIFFIFQVLVLNVPANTDQRAGETPGNLASLWEDCGRQSTAGSTLKCFRAEP